MHAPCSQSGVIGAVRQGIMVIIYIVTFMLDSSLGSPWQPCIMISKTKLHHVNMRVASPAKPFLHVPR